LPEPALRRPMGAALAPPPFSQGGITIGLPPIPASR
jgi:hypothetical protein